ncbi:hypothetical protein J31TS4_15040 [Paenibacillus sp. J31TS4]|uniref:HAD family hydrolase n=1 Tax=Paenibacillus sp. J31TS4 TaxID=2807195 RepID=UPI001B2DA4EF|nr:HAD family hydrolase [Paenibacillus sp. J31TS4]GIP38224.1 hypothetical protein J31TS4_15040 [Paenibacillus sp. J31TS4]
MKRLYTPDAKKVLFLDMNQTLLDPVQTFRDSFADVLKEYTARWDGEGFSPERLVDAYTAEWKKRSPKAGGVLLRERLRRQCLKLALQPLPMPVSERFAEAFLQKVKERGNEAPRLYPGVRDTLETLAKRYRLGIISNGRRERQERHLKLLGLDRWISPGGLFTSARKETRKPAPYLFRLALERMNAEPGEALMVGNSWAHDVVGAVRVGMDAVWLRADHPGKPAFRKLGTRKVAVIRRFEELKQLC